SDRLISTSGHPIVARRPACSPRSAPHSWAGPGDPGSVAPLVRADLAAGFGPAVDFSVADFDLAADFGPAALASRRAAGRLPALAPLFSFRRPLLRFPESCGRGRPFVRRCALVPGPAVWRQRSPPSVPVASARAESAARLL